LAQQGAISDAALERAAAAIAGMVKEANRHGVRAITGMGTAGLRIANTGNEVVAAIEKRTGAKLPLAQRILHARLEAPLLFFVADFEPDLDQFNAAVHDVILGLRAQFEKAAVLFLGAEAHDVFHTKAVIPTAIKDHHFPGGGEVRHITLDVHL
jgi:hypothetical protein